MYRILGADQKEYGPVNADQVRQWIMERRLNSQSLVQAEGTTDWKPLSAFPEFSALLAGAAAIPAPLSPTAAAGAPSNNGMATAGLVMGILSVVVGWACCGLFSILGVIFSCIGLSQINRNPGMQKGKGLAIAGLVLSILGLVGSVILGLLFGLGSHFHDLIREISR